MTLRSTLSIAVIFNIILHVYSEEINQELVGSDALQQEAYFYKLLEMTQHKNDHARHFLTVKKSLDSMGKSVPSTVYKRMKMKVLKSLHADYLYRRAMYDEQGQDYSHVECGLNIIPVQVPYLASGFSYPDFIHLNRCLGGCSYRSPSVIHCVVQGTSTVHVNIFQYNTHTKKLTEKVIAMVEHTECGCQCIVQKHHCDNATENYDPDQCKCLCKDLTHTCDTTIKKWDDKQCRCKCIYPPHPCSNENKVWSEDTCGCECNKYLKGVCESQNKLLNPHTCECHCSPNVVCPDGSELNSHDCSCV